MPDGAIRDPLTAREAASQLGLSIYWVRRLVRDGRIAARRDGRRIVIEPKALDAYRARIANRAADGGPITPADDWAWEGNVVVALVAHLEGEGWHVRSARTRRSGSTASISSSRGRACDERSR